MIKVENVEVFNFDGAIRGARNPLNSWEKSDSGYGCKNMGVTKCNTCGFDQAWCGSTAEFVIGENDLKLMRKLYQGGPEHRKYLRQIFVSMDITAPLYLWKEVDQYRIGVTTDSCSTMHTIHKKEFELDDFSWEHLGDINFDFDGEEAINGYYSAMCDECGGHVESPSQLLEFVIDSLNHYRNLFIKTNDKKYWWYMIQLLPSSYNQKRTITFNYENAVNMIRQREFHKLDEWREFVKVLRGLPYLEEIMGDMK